MPGGVGGERRSSTAVPYPDSGQENVLLDSIQSAIRHPGRTVLDAIKNQVEQWRPKWLGALTLRHLAELGEQYLPQIKQYADVVQQMATDRNVMQEEGGELAGRWQAWAKKNRAMNNATVSLMHDATIAGTDPAEAYQDIPLKIAGQTLEHWSFAGLRAQPRGDEHQGGQDDADLLRQHRQRRQQPCHAEQPAMLRRAH